MSTKEGNWFSSVKKALNPDSKEKKEQSETKAKKKWFGKKNKQLPVYSSIATVTTPFIPPQEEDVISSNVEIEQNTHIYPVAAVADSNGGIVDAVQHTTTASKFNGKLSEEMAAIKIQTAYRGYMARRQLKAFKGLARLTSLVKGQSVQRQAANTLKCMQTLSRVQSQIRSRRIRMSEENQALRKQLQLKYAKELENLQMSDEWDDSLQSKQQIETGMLSKHEAAMRRERAMAYAFSHQQTLKNSSRTHNPLFMDPSNPTWGWSWLERWMAARPWETKTNDHSSSKTTIHNIMNNGGEITKSFARHQVNSETPSPKSTSKDNPLAKRPSPSPPLTGKLPGKWKPASPRASVSAMDDESRSVQSEVNRRHTIAGSSVRDNESQSRPGSPSVPSYMQPTEAVKARLRGPSPLGPEKNGTPEKGSAGPTKKRLSYPASPVKPRRHSGPPKVETSTIAELSLGN